MIKKVGGLEEPAPLSKSVRIFRVYVSGFSIFQVELGLLVVTL
jgi:hypothetical protein